jgi:hypothetical protein
VHQACALNASMTVGNIPIESPTPDASRSPSLAHIVVCGCLLLLLLLHPPAPAPRLFHRLTPLV